ncbi:hypothetical protein [Spirosoma panaciterrae]|uniref:hypothetical protein n=1 Tax=Spirosoma panaciterrae TaxID=496058 RepID=UPI00037594C6|nr:hypothetical protein [Spirosoma panaciterrae]
MKQTHYATISEAVDALRQQGFSTDFRLEFDQLTCSTARLGADEFSIVDVYRYEGDSDPADEAIVYAIQSTTGLKGLLITGYGASEDAISEQIIAKLQRI